MYLVAVAYHLPRHDLCCWHIGNWLYSKFGVAYADTVIDAVANEVMHSPRKRWRADDIARELRGTIAGRIAIRAKGGRKIIAKQDGELKDGHRTWRWHLPSTETGGEQ
jgi:hypothetical protein